MRSGDESQAIPNPAQSKENKTAADLWGKLEQIIRLALGFFHHLCTSLPPSTSWSHLPGFASIYHSPTHLRLLSGL
uniref:Uncharacterized protein n=1 Tax=Knipowitschia caucasica TaxID=637954 RepID=A0AAV2JC01_KNICA